MSGGPQGSARERWNAKFGAKPEQPGEPDPFVVRHAGRLKPGSVLDIAAGDGRNALFLAGRGFRVLALDCSDVALGRLSRFAVTRSLDIAARQIDLEAPDFDPGAVLDPADDIVIVNYKPTPRLFAALPGLLAPGGRLLYCAYNTRHAAETGFNPDFCIAPGAYADGAPGLAVLCFEPLDEPGSHRDGYLFERL